MSSLQLKCPNCSADISPADINVAIDVAKCSSCDNIFRVSELVGVEAEKAKAKVTEMPKGTKIKVQRGLGNTTEIIMPARGFKPTDLFIMGFATFWVGFLVVWTTFALMGSTFFALFSIPFWLAGAAMWVGVINSMREVETVQIDHTSITIRKERPVMSKTVKYALSEIEDVRLMTYVPTTASAFNPETFSSSGRLNNLVRAEEPAIISGKGTTYFFIRANMAEKQWIVYFLDTLVEKYK